MPRCALQLSESGAVLPLTFVYWIRFTMWLNQILTLPPTTLHHCYFENTKPELIAITKSFHKHKRRLSCQRSISSISSLPSPAVNSGSGQGELQKRIQLNMQATWTLHHIVHTISLIFLSICR
jgi:hypothetical protein